MQRYEWLVKKRNGYLNYSYKIITKIEKLNAKIDQETERCIQNQERDQKVIEEAYSRIKDTQKGLTFLSDTKKQNISQIKKIAHLVKPEESEKPEKTVK